MPRICKLAISLWFVVLCTKLFAQPFKSGQFVIGAMYQSQYLGKNLDLEKVYGINASYFLSDRWSLEYSISYVDVPFGTNYFKLYGGGALAGYGTILASNNISTNGYWAFVLLSLVVPEGVSYHIPLNNQIALSPYINLLTVDISSQYWRMSNTAGVRLNMVLNETFNVAPYAFTTVQYRGNSVGGSVGGLGVGVLGRWVF